ncbi:MAG TPA: hypothetical protein VGP11_02000, partial [Acidimicrobiales bacterium]|nr:hypothetical protein [Acidimicrobiales bacterium]
QSGNRDDEKTGSKQLRRAFYKHLQPIDIDEDQRGVQGKLNEAREKMSEKMAKLPRRHRKEQ